MTTLKSYTSIKLFTVCLVTISILGTSCTSLQQSTAVAADDLYDIPNQSVVKKTIPSDEQIATEILNGEEEYQEYQNYQDDRYLRLKVANRNRWSSIDDYGYWNDPRFNYAYYPSYLGWNSWYNGYYGASWYNPFGYSFSLGWGGYSPFVNSYYSMGWGYGGFGYDPFWSVGFGYGGFGYGGWGYGYGWNPYYASYWNPYGYYYGGIYGGVSHYGRPHNNYPARRAMQTSGPGLNAYRNTRSFNTTNNSVNSTNGSVRYTGNPDLNSRFGNLVKRVVTNNSNTNQANSFDRPARYFNGNNFNSNYNKGASSNNNYKSSSNSAPSFNSNAGGRSGGFNSSGSSSSGSGRAPRGGGRN